MPISAFYKAECGVNVNILAELVADRNARVRLRCCEMLSYFMTCLPDRYDHQQRLLPYLLSFYNDNCEKVSRCAFTSVETLGEQYEAENSDAFVERRQFGVDGDSRCNHEEQLPCPFKKRPRIGSRMFVRSNTKRFFATLLAELTCWSSKTRERSAKLLQTLVIYCEEHLTMDFAQTLMLLIQAIKLVSSEQIDRESSSLMKAILDAITLIGRYIDPNTYIPFLLPRATGKIDSENTYAEGGVDSEATKTANASALAAMIKGSLPSRLLPHSSVMTAIITDENAVGTFVGSKLKTTCLRVLVNFLQRVNSPGCDSSHYCKHDKCNQVKIKNQLDSCRIEFEKISKNSEDTETLSLVKMGIKSLPKVF